MASQTARFSGLSGVCHDRGPDLTGDAPNPARVVGVAFATRVGDGDEHVGASVSAIA